MSVLYLRRGRKTRTGITAGIMRLQRSQSTMSLPSYNRTYLKEQDIEKNTMGLKIHEIGKEVLRTLLPEFFDKKEYVELAYLFGSIAEETEGPLSDIDIGVYLSSKLTKGERIEKRLELMGELSTLLKNDHVDLLVMNDAAPVINFEVIRPNVPLFVRNEDLKLDVEQYIMSRYLDRKYHEDFLNNELLKRIREKRGIQDVSSR